MGLQFLDHKHIVSDIGARRTAHGTRPSHIVHLRGSQEAVLDHHA